MDELTAEQVREAVESNTWAETSSIREFNDSSWQAIADELNAKLDTRAERTCHAELNEQRNAVICSECGSPELLMGWGEYKNWEGSTCIASFTTYNYCPSCGAKVIGAE